ncbi:YciI family protein [Nitratireductor thuwali]|uniref:YCII-related domain-containing protein n=1 Tax=Nitratireductor thuwali TaxID=2267699 RepID=A0ABY5MEK9_9HYPH|nr:hypothetical protein NTH_00069 [Nitratireductor thuwali]
MGIPVENVKQASSAMLQKELYAIFTVPTGGIEPILEGLEEHLAFQTGLERDGIMFAAGPMWSNDGSEWNGDGLVVVRASSREEAILIAERDPMHISGARRFTVRPWMVNEGTMTVRLAMSSQTFTLL